MSKQLNIQSHTSSQKGFTLVELIVVIVILGILSATAIPKFINVSNDARIASINALAGTLKSTANIIYAKCMVTPTCDMNSMSTRFDTGNGTYNLNYGWVDAGDALNDYMIDTAITYSGFKVKLVDNQTTMFYVENAPDPDNCSVSYLDAYSNPNKTITVVTQTSGC